MLAEPWDGLRGNAIRGNSLLLSWTSLFTTRIFRSKSLRQAVTSDSRGHSQHGTLQYLLQSLGGFPFNRPRLSPPCPSVSTHFILIPNQKLIIIRMGDYGENKGPVGGVKPPTPTVTSTSGSLYGDSSLLGGNAPLPDPEQDSAIVKDPKLVNGQEADPKLGLYLDFDGVDVPQPIRGELCATDPGPRTYDYERLNPDLFAPPGTDAGDVPNAMWPLGLSHNRLGSETGAGWARQQNQDVLPAATAMAGVDMRLAPNAYRELHWHTANEWALVTKGCLRVAAVNDEGKSFVDDLCEGDVWFFPAGIPHSLQAFDKGVEFLLVFDQGTFSEDETFLVSELFLRNPVSVLAKNFETETTAFDNIPKDELYVSTLPQHLSTA